jgi:hypothetical protein
MTEALSNTERVVGELSPVYASSDGVVNLVSVLVSVQTTFPTKPLLHTQMALEARLGIEHQSGERRR